METHNKKQVEAMQRKLEGSLDRLNKAQGSVHKELPNIKSAVNMFLNKKPETEEEKEAHKIMKEAWKKAESELKKYK